MKVDFQSPNYSLSAINSILLSGNDYQSKNLTSSIMLRGGQIKRKFGALSLGASFATMYNQVNSREDGTNIKGTVHDYTPTPIYYAVRILDDSPSDNQGPVIYEVNLLVNGVKRPDIKTIYNNGRH